MKLPEEPITISGSIDDRTSAGSGTVGGGERVCDAKDVVDGARPVEPASWGVVCCGYVSPALAASKGDKLLDGDVGESRCTIRSSDINHTTIT